jgi:hypothetical protein
MCALDFNTADEQRESLGAIPAGSMVKVRMSIRQPEVAGTDPMLKLSKKGDCEMLDCEFEVVAGQYHGRKIWNNYIIDGTTEGHKKAGQISMRTMRAVVEAVRGISPKDQTPAACQARRLNQWGDLHGVEFGIIVAITPPKAGDRYVNNEIKRVLTADDEAYSHVMAGGEIITDAPVPEIPQASQSAAPGWAAPPMSPAAPAAPVQGTFQAPPRTPPVAPPPPKAAGSTPPPSSGAAPGWTAPAGSQMPPPPAFPSEARGMDDVPF